MKTSQSYKNIINLEYFLHRDANISVQKRQKRDRKIYLQLEEQEGNGISSSSTATDQDLLNWWLKKRQEGEFSSLDTKSPGGFFQDTLRLANTFAIIKGIVAGAIGGVLFFTYTGSTPVNVFLFLLVFVFSQLLFSSLWLFATLIRRLLPAVKLPTFYSTLVLKSVMRLGRVIHKQWQTNVSADKRISSHYALGLIKAKSSLFGELFYWPLFCLTQLFGIGFNCGLVTIMMVKVTTSDLAFGWQSTIQLSATAIHKAVEIISLPWAIFLSDLSPSLEEIEGSRIILKNGIYHLATPDLISWWPFLVLSLLTYGLLVRVLLFIGGKIVEKSKLSNFSLQTPPYRALLSRMKTPIVTTQARAEKEMEKTLQTEPVVTQKPVADEELQLYPQLTLVPDDIYDTCSQKSLDDLLKDNGLCCKQRYRFQESYEKDEELKEIFKVQNWQGDGGIFILMEGWMVPLVDFITYLKEVRELIGPKVIITVGLIGRPATTIFTPVEEDAFRIWDQKLVSLADPYLHLIPLTQQTAASKVS